ncbi:MAG: hypothetical protein HYT13_00300 [Candidatus Liptonbacteria bacterium]|nr:hypothetical protein [Candidatus Liptonbacteria bacterium]
MSEMARGYVRRKNLTKDTLLGIATVGVLLLTGAGGHPALSRALLSYFKDKVKAARWARARKIRELEKRKLISIQENDDDAIRIELTHRGKRVVRQYHLDNLKLKVPSKWNGYWHLAIYDIPSSKRRASDALRQKLRDMGLFQLQKSVWVAPYPFLEELEFLTVLFEIELNKHIYYFRSRELPREKEIRRFFFA